ncbi:hypothetical protein ACLBOM_04255 [Escherichia coli]
MTKALNDCRKCGARSSARSTVHLENLCQPLAEVGNDAPGRIFSPVSHLNSVKNSPQSARSVRRNPAAAVGIQHLGRAT